MGKKTTLFMVAAGSLLAFTGPVRGQEVNSDVKIPPPRELASGAPAINGRQGYFGSQSGPAIFLGKVGQEILITWFHDRVAFALVFSEDHTAPTRFGENVAPDAFRPTSFGAVRSGDRRVPVQHSFRLFA